MDIHDLTREQLIELKESYLYALADKGDYAEVLDTDHDEPSYDDLADVDDLVPDDVVFDYYDGMTFTEDDFAG